MSAINLEQFVVTNSPPLALTPESLAEEALKMDVIAKSISLYRLEQPLVDPLHSPPGSPLKKPAPQLVSPARSVRESNPLIRPSTPLVNPIVPAQVINPPMITPARPIVPAQVINPPMITPARPIMAAQVVDPSTITPAVTAQIANPSQLQGIVLFFPWPPSDQPLIISPVTTVRLPLHSLLLGRQIRLVPRRKCNGRQYTHGKIKAFINNTDKLLVELNEENKIKIPLNKETFEFKPNEPLLINLSLFPNADQEDRSKRCYVLGKLELFSIKENYVRFTIKDSSSQRNYRVLLSPKNLYSLLPPGITSGVTPTEKIIQIPQPNGNVNIQTSVYSFA